jgi:hypothetical protein
MGFRADFSFVDIHSSALKQWRRVKLDQVDKELIIPSKGYRCFKSVQRYEKPHAEPGEKVWMPIFFDLDSKEDPGRAIEDVKRIHNFATEILGINHHYIRTFFSGKKGFHVIIEPECFDIRPDPEIHLKVRKAAMYLKDLLKLDTFDTVVYSRRRVLRMPNSIHEDTKLYKIELSLGEVCKGIDWIKAEAKMPRKSGRAEEPDEEIPVCEDAKIFWDKITAEVGEAKELSNLRPDHKIKDFGDLPVCMKYLLTLSRLPAANTGNRTILSMASYLKDAGKSEQEALDLLIPWALKLENIGWANKPGDLEPAIASTVKYVYHRGDDDKEGTYHFACKYILALSTPEHKIPCQGLQCPAIKGKLQETKEVIPLELSDFSKSIYLGEKVRVPTLVSGKAGTPYVVPKRVRFTCTPDVNTGEFCKGCPVAQFNGEASFEFDVRDQEILEIVNCSNKDQWTAIYRKFRFPSSCRQAKPRVEEYMNIEEIRMSPAAVDIQNFERSEFVNRRGFFLGYPLKSNKRYTVTGFPVKDPKNQSSAFIFVDHEKLETEVETFQMTPEIRRELVVFQAEKDGLEERWDAIHADLSANVYRIWNRRDMAWAIDLIAHSVRGFRFRSEPFVKGWAELLIVGDSGQGKSALARRLLQDHYRIGEYVPGGSARRTGMLYSFQESGKTWMLIWGALPLNDLGLVVIDEFGDLPEDQFAIMTDVRSSGIVKAVGVVTAETYARVRLIALSNPKKKEHGGGKHLAEYEYPCVALKELVPAPEDIRRFDLAMTVSSGEVNVETINRADFEAVPHVYTARLCRMLVQWAWSRKESDIEFTDAASRLVLSEATRMAKDFYAGDIPLVEPADQRFKVARLAVACAARVFSTDETGEKVLVTEEHVHFASMLLYHIYTHPNFRYGEWSKGQRKTDVSDSADLAGAFEKLKEMHSWRKVLGLLLLPGQIDAREVENLLEGRRAESMQVISVLRILGLVEKKWGKFSKTPKGNQLALWAVDSGKVVREEIEREMMGFTQSAFDYPHERTQKEGE